MFSTTGFIGHQEIKQYCGIVSGTVVAGIGFARDLVASFKDFTGGRIGGYEDSLEMAKVQAVARMEEQAATLGADAVMGIQLSFGVFSPDGKGTVAGIIAYGTAVKLKNQPNVTAAPERPLLRDLRDEPDRSPAMHRHTGAGFEWGR